MTPSSEPRAARRGGYLLTLALAALGVVYGDIGTSPLYALRESFYGTHGIAVTPGNVLGVLSLVFWALVIVASDGNSHSQRRLTMACAFAIVALRRMWARAAVGRPCNDK